MAHYFAPGTYSVQSTGASYSHTFDSTTDIHRFEIRGGDAAVFGNAGTQRSELSSSKKLAFNTTYTMTWRFLIEAGSTNTSDWILLGQAHASEDSGEPGLSPFFAAEIYASSARMRIMGRYSNTNPTASGNVTNMVLYLDPTTTTIARGVWVNMHAIVRFNSAGNGLCRVWRDGVQIVNYSGPLGYNDQTGPYMKMGIYRDQAAETIAVQYDTFEIVTGEILPGGQTEPPPPGEGNFDARPALNAWADAEKAALASRKTAIASQQTAIASQQTALASAQSALASAQTALGTLSTALGSQSTALGSQSTALGNQSTALTAEDDSIDASLAALTTLEGEID